MESFLSYVCPCLRRESNKVVPDKHPKIERTPELPSRVNEEAAYVFKWGDVDPESHTPYGEFSQQQRESILYLSSK
jgi:hypothetical protein